MSTELNLDAERAAFERIYAELNHSTPGGGWNDFDAETGRYHEEDTHDAWVFWQAARRTAPVSAPLDTQALPQLPEPFAFVEMANESTASVYSADQYRQGQREAIAPYAERIRHLERELAERKPASLSTALLFELVEQAKKLPDLSSTGTIPLTPIQIAFIAGKLADGRTAGTEWISVNKDLPQGECLAVYVTEAGKQRLIRAKYARQFQIEAEGDDCETEYNEEDDTFYIKAGWLECIDNWGEYSSCYVVEGTVTHWMTLPAAPSSMSKGKEEAN